MIRLETLKCPHCGADVPVPPEDATSARCEYCGHTAQILRPEPEPPPPPPPPPPRPREAPRAPPPDVINAAMTKRSSKGCLAIPIVIVAAVASLIAYAVHHDYGSFQWRGQTIAATINGDAVEDYLGLYASRSQKDYPLYVGAFDGASQSEIWRAGPYGKNEVTVVVVGTWVVVADASAAVHVLALATGKEAGMVTLSDKVQSTCAPPDTKDTLWIGTSDAKPVLLDLATRAVRPSPRPASCGASPPSDCRKARSVGTTCSEPKSALKIDGFHAKLMLTEGDSAVVAGEKSPGTSTPMAIGLDAATGTVRWQKTLTGSPPSAYESRLGAVDMSGGTLVASYAANDKKTNGGRLMALDARTGAPLWDVAVPNSDSVATASDLIVTSTRVYFSHWVWVDVYDVRTGAHIATQGAW